MSKLPWATPEVTVKHLIHGNDINHPRIIVVHAMGEYIKDAETLHAVEFLDKCKYSAHALASPDGKIFRLREDNETAWHARGNNSNSLGIEFLVKGEHDYGSFLERIKAPWLTDEQYQSGLWQILEWIDIHQITKIVRHSDISPGRKVDPGAGFPWEELLNDIRTWTN